MNGKEYIRMQGITKSFGQVLANDDVSLSLKKGEIHALLGENGSGKSTLMNVLAGIYAPDSGTVSVGGKTRTIGSPREAIGLGIGMIHQHFKLVDVFSATENIIAGCPGSVLLERKAQRKAIKELCERYGTSLDPDRKVREMSVSERQTVEILKALYRGADVLILDEPTAVLTPKEIDRLFDILRKMRELGCAIVLISHKLQEVRSLCDRVTVLRKGRLVGTVDTAEVSDATLAELMVGYAVDLDVPRTDCPDAGRRTVVEVRNLSVFGPRRRKLLEDLDFTVRSSEILGVAGIAGSGQKELCEVLAGYRKADCGTVTVETGKQFGTDIGFVPEDRLGMGLAGGLTITDNMLLRSYRNARGPFVDRRGGQRMAEDVIRRYSISTPGPQQVVRRLSGGNIQKVLLGREIDRNPAFLITAYPVRGLDIGSTRYIYSLLDEERKKGSAILFVGEDLDALLALCDRIMVLCGGRIAGMFDARTVDKDTLGLAMMGGPAC